MGAITGLLGLNGGINGTGFQTTAPTNAGQLSTAYNDTQNALQGQQGLLSALQGQNGLGNQSQVYNQLQGVVNGTGPNPAQAMLAQQTGQNIAAQSALMAGQRGAGANAGLLARQAAQQGAATQQNAVGQAATLQANQSLNALNQAGTQANTMAGQQIGQTNANTASQQATQGQLLGAQGQYNNTEGSLVNGAQSGQQSGFGGLFNGVGSALSSLGGSGAAKALTAAGAAFAQGGQVGPQSHFGRMMCSGGNTMKSGGKVDGKPAVGGAKDSYSNDTVKALLSPGEIVLPRSITQGKNPAGDAAKFVQAIMSKKGKK